MRASRRRRQRLRLHRCLRQRPHLGADHEALVLLLPPLQPLLLLLLRLRLRLRRAAGQPGSCVQQLPQLQLPQRSKRRSKRRSKSRRGQCAGVAAVGDAVGDEAEGGRY